jgi:RimJ/RimL family protein N-acetyltransferase
LMAFARKHEPLVDGERIHTARLLLRPWALDDAEAALAVFGAEEVSRWLAPAVERVPDIASMRAHLGSWMLECASLDSCQGRWAVVLRETGEVVGGVSLLPLPPYDIDLQVGWQIAPTAWGNGFATEAGHAVAHYAFEAGLDEIFAVVRPQNEKGAATARRVGMEWVGVTEKYYELVLEVYRLRRGDLDVPALDVETRTEHHEYTFTGTTDRGAGHEAAHDDRTGRPSRRGRLRDGARP